MRILVSTVAALCAFAPAAGMAEGVGPVVMDNTQIVISGNAHKRTFPCNGRKLVIEGSDHVVTATGVCSSVEVSGVKNTVTAEISPKGKLMVEGADNVVKWKSAGEPAQDISGVQNRVSKLP